MPSSLSSFSPPFKGWERLRDYFSSLFFLKNVKLTHNSTPSGKEKSDRCDMILFIGGPVDWEGEPVDWQAWETWMGDIGYRGRVCVTLLSLESERK